MTKLYLFAILGAISTAAVPALAQQSSGQPGQTRKVLAKRTCNDGSSTIVSWNGELIVVEYFSAPRADGIVSGYEDAYDRKDAAEAKAQFDALACPEG